MTSEELNKNLDIKQCGCGGEPVVGYIETFNRWYIGCPNCDICTRLYNTAAEVATAWNTAMGGLLPEGDPQKNVGCKYTTTTERTAKVISDDIIITVNGYKYHHEEYLCNACKNKVFSCDSYCSHCGARLDWRHL